MNSTNVTLQKFLNSGYTILANETISGSGALPAHDLTSKILISAIPSDATADFGFVGSTSSSSGDAFPLFIKTIYVDPVGSAIRPLYQPTDREFETTTPEDFYLIASGTVDFRVLYLKLNQ